MLAILNPVFETVFGSLQFKRENTRQWVLTQSILKTLHKQN